MAVKDPLQQAREKYGQTPVVELRADRSTGEKPMELFITDEHVPNYLTLRAGGDVDKGLYTGVFGGVAFFSVVAVFLMALFKSRWDLLLGMSWICVPLLIVPFIWEVSRPLPLPVLFNRRTREVYFDHNGTLYHTPWDGIRALAAEYMMVGTHTGGMRNASLEILVHRFGAPEDALMVSLGLPMGKSLAMQKAFWEYLRSYMNNGPWFDENGQHCESDAFVKRQLAAHMNPTSFLGFRWQNIKDKRRASGGRNYLSGSDLVLFVGHLLFYPMNWIQEFTYNIAKRRSRNRWPELVMERLRADGPTTRLIDLEHGADKPAASFSS